MNPSPSAPTLTFDDLGHLTGGRIGMHDVACPHCGPGKRGASAKRRVLRVWHEDDGFVTYKCARCDIAGYARRNGAETTRIIPPRKCNMRGKDELDGIKRKQNLAREIWEVSQPAP